MNQLMKKLIVPAMFAAGVSVMSGQSTDMQKGYVDTYKGDAFHSQLDALVASAAETPKLVENDTVRTPVKMGAYADDFATFGSIRAYGVDGKEITNAKVVVVPNGYPYARQITEVSKDAPFAQYFTPVGASSDVYIIPQGKFSKKYDTLKTEAVLEGGVQSFYLPLDVDK